MCGSPAWHKKQGNIKWRKELTVYSGPRSGGVQDQIPGNQSDSRGCCLMHLYCYKVFAGTVVIEGRSTQLSLGVKREMGALQPAGISRII